MSYTFATKKNTAITVTLPVDSDVTGFTLTAEFSYKKSFSTVALTKPLTGSAKTVTLSLSAAEVDSLNDIHYRVKAVKAGVTSYIGSGDVDYQPGAEQDAPKERYIPSRLSDANLNSKYGSVQTHHSVALFSTFSQAPSGRTICGVDSVSGKVWSYNSGGLYQVDSLTATNWAAVTLPANINPSGQAAKVVVWTTPGGARLMFLVSWNTVTTRYEVYSAPLVAKGTAPTWSSALFQLSANATLIPTAIRATSTGLYVGEYSATPDIAGGPSIHRWDGTTHTVSLGPLAGARHIHSVYEDPYVPGTVYAMIGDFFTPYTPPAAVYKSTGGAAFQPVVFANAPSAASTLQGVSMGFTSDYIWVASDQVQGGGPYVFTRDSNPSWRWATMRSRQDKIAVPGAVGGRILTDVALNSNNTMTSASGAFTANDVGKYVGGHNALQVGTFIQSVQSATSVTLSQPAGNTSTAQTVVISGDTFYANAYAGVVDPSTGWFYVVANDGSNAGNVAGIFVLTGLDKPFTLLWTLPLANIGNHETFIAGGYLFVDRYGPLPLFAA